LNGLVGTIIRNAFRDLRDDDDEETFDEKNWGWNRMAAMLISDPLYGFPVVGEAVESAIFNAFGVYTPSGPLFDIAPAVPAAKRMLTEYPAQVLEGEAEFRDGERRVIARLLAEEPRVLATGGGAFMHAETRLRIAERGLSVWLKADFDVLMRRVRKRSNRPLLSNPDPEGTLRRLIDQRYPVYALADETIQSRDVPHEVIVGEIIARLSERLGPAAPTP
jgi:shikimate kinase